MYHWISVLTRAIERTLGAPLLFVLLISSPCLAQSLSFLSGGGAKTLTITSAVAGSEPDEVIDDLTELTWDANGIGATAKITVDTSVPSQAFSLFVALDLTSGSGTEQAERELSDGMSDADLLRDIPTGSPTGVGTLTYRASATASQGNSSDNGSDVHTITYTILAQ
jgi:hypothetical protein